MRVRCMHASGACKPGSNTARNTDDQDSLLPRQSDCIVRNACLAVLGGVLYCEGVKGVLAATRRSAYGKVAQIFPPRAKPNAASLAVRDQFTLLQGRGRRGGTRRAGWTCPCISLPSLESKLTVASGIVVALVGSPALSHASHRLSHVRASDTQRLGKTRLGY